MPIHDLTKMTKDELLRFAGKNKIPVKKSLLKKEIFVPASGVGVWLVLLWPVISNMGGSGDDGGLLSRVTDATADPMQKFASEIFSRLDVLSWGGAVFLLGGLVLLVGSIMTFLEAKKG